MRVLDLGCGKRCTIGALIPAMNVFLILRWLNEEHGIR